MMTGLGVHHRSEGVFTLARNDRSRWAGIRNHVRSQVQAAFRARRFSSELFVIVAGNWAWGAGST